MREFFVQKLDPEIGSLFLLLISRFQEIIFLFLVNFPKIEHMFYPIL